MRPKRLLRAVAYREAVGASQRRDWLNVDVRQSDALYLLFTIHNAPSSLPNHAT
jgi:hypothetical protein